MDDELRYWDKIYGNEKGELDRENMAEKENDIASWWERNWSEEILRLEWLHKKVE
jgi:hypothetical protein